jgi:hypothetical protein
MWALGRLRLRLECLAPTLTVESYQIDPDLLDTALYMPPRPMGLLWLILAALTRR